jgi:ParB family chromosome partitioning protein
MAIKKGGLGKGLDALFDENATDGKGAVELNINEIEPNKSQPRKDFDQEAISFLAESIAKHGLLQPIIVRPKLNGAYEIVAGERRWRASRIAGLNRVPVIIKEMDEQTLAEVALVENLQREDLNPVEEALGYQFLMERFGLTQESVAQSVGKSRAAVANALRLLKLNDYMLQSLKDGKISAGHARAILSAKDEEIADYLYSLALDGASVRTLEALANKPLKKDSEGKKQAKLTDNTFYTEVALSLKQELHRKVSIKSTGKGKGTITLEFYSDEELRDFAKRLADK